MVRRHVVLTGLDHPLRRAAPPHLAPEWGDPRHRHRARWVEEAEGEPSFRWHIVQWRAGWRRRVCVEQVRPGNAGRQWAPVSSSMTIGARRGTSGTSGITTLCRITASMGRCTPAVAETSPEKGPAAITTRSAETVPERRLDPGQPVPFRSALGDPAADHDLCPGSRHQPQGELFGVEEPVAAAEPCLDHLGRQVREAPSPSSPSRTSMSRLTPAVLRTTSRAVPRHAAPTSWPRDNPGGADPGRTHPARSSPGGCRGAQPSPEPGAAPPRCRIGAGMHRCWRESSASPGPDAAPGPAGGARHARRRRRWRRRPHRPR